MCADLWTAVVRLACGTAVAVSTLARDFLRRKCTFDGVFATVLLEYLTIARCLQAQSTFVATEFATMTLILLLGIEDAHAAVCDLLRLSPVHLEGWGAR